MQISIESQINQTNQTTQDPDFLEIFPKIDKDPKNDPNAVFV